MREVITISFLEDIVKFVPKGMQLVGVRYPLLGEPMLDINLKSVRIAGAGHLTLPALILKEFEKKPNRQRSEP